MTKQDTTREAVERAFRDVAVEETAVPTLVEQLELGTRASNCLAKAKIVTVKQLLRRSMFDLFKVRGFGGRTLREIVEILRENGLTLRPDKYDRVMGEYLRQDVLLARRQYIKRQTQSIKRQVRFAEALRERSAAIRKPKDGE